ncbi:MAG: Gx transporter family protein [Clostridia bacterium]|nr:Gx transporter family protein [Clostridia bacterium]
MLLYSLQSEDGARKISPENTQGADVKTVANGSGKAKPVASESATPARSAVGNELNGEANTATCGVEANSVSGGDCKKAVEGNGGTQNGSAQFTAKQARRHPKTAALSLTACLLAIALIFSYVEMLIFPAVFPGVKLGLANIAVMFAFFIIGKKYAVAVALLRAVLSAVLFGNASTFLFSLFGTALSLSALFLSLLFGEKISRIGVGVMSCAMHGIGQIFAAMMMYSSFGIIYYLPVLLITSVPLGAFSGVLLLLVEDRLKKHYGGKR